VSQLGAAGLEELTAQLEPRAPFPLSRQVNVYRALLDPRRRGVTERKFLIFCQGRTGSTLLTHLLSSGDDVVCDGETLSRRALFPRLWVEGLRAKSGARAYGCKVKIYQLTVEQRVKDPAAWLRTMHDHGWRVISLRRTNIVRHVMSNMVLVQSGQPHRYGDEWHVDQVTVPIDDFLTLVRQRVAVGEAERAALEGIPHIEFEYERDLLDPSARQSVVDRAYDFLEIPRSPLVDSPLRRTSIDDLRQLVANYDELAEALRDTPFAAQLDA
jgi:hypothetical protein